MIITPDERARAHRALMDGICAIEERIAPLWTTPNAALSRQRRRVRAHVTANGFRELDVLLAHWVGMVAMRPVRMAEIGRWREDAKTGDAAIRSAFTPAEIMRLAAEYRMAAPCPSGDLGCGLAA